MTSDEFGNAAQPLVVIGGGAHAREVIWLAREATQAYNVLGCLDDAEGSRSHLLSGVPVLGRVSEWPRFADAAFVVAIGTPRIRRDVVQRMYSSGVPRFATLVHRSVLQSSYVQIGPGSMVLAGCIASTQIIIGSHVILNIGATVAHDAVIEDYCTLAPRVVLSGNVHLEAGVELGTCSSLKQGIRVGRGAMVGMGSVVTRDVAEADLVLGNPARSVRKLDTF
jgi:sugar O-acyltransferase (sialic acid O-acetyltransferase NeuD family)